GEGLAEADRAPTGPNRAPLRGDAGLPQHPHREEAAPAASGRDARADALQIRDPAGLDALEPEPGAVVLAEPLPTALAAVGPGAVADLADLGRRDVEDPLPLLAGRRRARAHGKD